MKESNDLKCVFSGSQCEALLVAEILEKAGISSICRNEYQSSVTAGFFGGIPSTIDIFIKEEDLKNAIPIIKDFNQQHIEGPME